MHCIYLSLLKVNKMLLLYHIQHDFTMKITNTYYKHIFKRELRFQALKAFLQELQKADCLQRTNWVDQVTALMHCVPLQQQTIYCCTVIWWERQTQKYCSSKWFQPICWELCDEMHTHFVSQMYLCRRRIISLIPPEWKWRAGRVLPSFKINTA